jgi:hypothetical protein
LKSLSIGGNLPSSLSNHLGQTDQRDLTVVAYIQAG